MVALFHHALPPHRQQRRGQTVSHGTAWDFQMTQNYAMSLILQCSSNQAMYQAHFYVAFDLVQVGASSPGYKFLGYPVSPGTTGADERLTVSGFTAGASWTVAVYAMVPPDGWDSSIRA